MSDPQTQAPQATGSMNGAASSELEARLGHLLEQRRLGALLEQALAEAGQSTAPEAHEKPAGKLADQARADLDRINAELARFQNEYCTDAAHEEAYDSALERILGFNPRIDLNEIKEILAGRQSCDMKPFLEDLERPA
jgi:hypothetical protein